MALTELYDRATSLLEKRFLKNAFLPVAVFPVVLALPHLMQGERLTDAVDLWTTLPTAGKLLIGLVYFALSWFIAAILASQWRNIIRLFEGYPIKNTALGRASADWHRRGLDASTGWVRYYRYPERAEVLPTRLGNILLAAERYPYYRYGAESIILWPRLHHVLPEAFLVEIDSARANLEFLLVTSCFWGAFGVLEFWILTTTGSPFWLAITCLVAGSLGARLAYESSLPSAQEYGERIRTGVELHRMALLRALSLRIPTSHDEEREVWDALLAFVRKNEDERLEQFRADGVAVS